jgi:hypothetical protein
MVCSGGPDSVLRLLQGVDGEVEIVLAVAADVTAALQAASKLIIVLTSAVFALPTGMIGGACVAAHACTSNHPSLLVGS